MLDKKDERLFALLRQDSRSHLSRLAKEVRLSRETVNYRIKRLQDRGIITGFVTVVDVARLGYTNFGIYVRLTEPHAQGLLAEKLREHGNVVWVATVGGIFDLVAEIVCKNGKELARIYEDLFEQSHGSIADTQITVRTTQEHLRMESEECDDGIVNLGAGERSILRLLAENSRLPNTDISRETGIPASTVAMKIKKLRESGVIRGFTVATDAEKLGLQTFKAFLQLQDPSHGTKRKVRSYARDHQQANYYVECLGPWSIEIELDVLNIQEYRNAIFGLQTSLGREVRTAAFIVIFKEHKITYFTESLE